MHPALASGKGRRNRDRMALNPMAIGSALRFRLLLDLVKQVIFVVDEIPLRVTLFTHRTAPRRLHVPEIGRSVVILSGSRSLTGWFVAPECPPRAALLLFHGIGDRLVYWRRAQQWLAHAGIASLVFHYSGYRPSQGETTPANLEQDAHAANACLRQLAPGLPVFLLGFSLGSGLAAQVADTLKPLPNGLILAQGFTSLRLAATRIVRPFAMLSHLLPDLWKTRESIVRTRLPLLILHTTGDKLFPVSMAEELFAAAQSGGVPAELRVLPDHAHNAPYQTVPEDYWTVVLDFISRHREVSTPGVE